MYGVKETASPYRELSGKWKLELLYRLAQGPARWSVLVHSFPEAAPNVLTRQLRQLEEAGLVLRVVTSPLPPQAIEYRLSPRGQRLGPVLDAMGDWAVACQQSMTG